MNFLDVLQIGAGLIALSGCGKAPELPTTGTTLTADPGQPTSPTDPVLTAPPVATPDPSDPAVTVDTFAYHNTTAICAAITSWNSLTTTIWFPVNSATPVNEWYVFRADGVWIADQNKVIQGIIDPFGETVVIQQEGSVGQPPRCYITVTQGKFIGIHS